MSIAFTLSPLQLLTFFPQSLSNSPWRGRWPHWADPGAVWPHPLWLPRVFASGDHVTTHVSAPGTAHLLPLPPFQPLRAPRPALPQPGCQPAGTWPGPCRRGPCPGQSEHFLRVMVAESVRSVLRRQRYELTQPPRNLVPAHSCWPNLVIVLRAWFPLLSLSES